MDKLKIPFSNKSFCSYDTLVVSLKKINSDPLVIENGEIMPCNDSHFTNQSVCYILVWSSDIDKGWKGRGLGLYYGSGHVMTAKHILENDECHENDNIYVIFPTSEYSVIYKARKIFPKNTPMPLNYDLAFIDLQGCLDPLQNIKVEIGELRKNDELHFSVLEKGNFAQKNNCITVKPIGNMKNLMSSEYEFVVSKAGKAGDSGTPIFSSSGRCVGIYIGAFTENNSLKPSVYGRALQFDRKILPSNLF